MLIELKYTFVFKEDNEVFEGFFPDLKDLGVLSAPNQEELFKMAKVAERKYCKKKGIIIK